MKDIFLKIEKDVEFVPFPNFLHFNQVSANGKLVVCVIVYRENPKSPTQTTNLPVVDMGVSKNGGTPQPWVFLLKMLILGCF